MGIDPGASGAGVCALFLNVEREMSHFLPHQVIICSRLWAQEVDPTTAKQANALIPFVMLPCQAAMTLFALG